MKPCFYERVRRWWTPPRGTRARPSHSTLCFRFRWCFTTALLTVRSVRAVLCHATAWSDAPRVQSILPHAIHETQVSLPVVPAVRGRARDCRWSEHTETSSRGRKQLLHSDNYSQYTGRIFAKSILAILFWPWSPSVWRVNNPTHTTSTRYAS